MFLIFAKQGAICEKKLLWDSIIMGPFYLSEFMDK